MDFLWSKLVRLCPEEKKINLTAYMLRINKAREMMKEIESQNVKRKREVAVGLDNMFVAS